MLCKYTSSCTSITHKQIQKCNGSPGASVDRRQRRAPLPWILMVWPCEVGERLLLRALALTNPPSTWEATRRHARRGEGDGKVMG